MDVDLLLDPFGARWTELRDAAGAAVDAGFRGIWTHDHVDGRVYDSAHVLECWTILSALATVAPSVVLGPMVLNVANRHPGVLAARAATLQHVSEGRLLLGLGAGAQHSSAQFTPAGPAPTMTTSCASSAGIKARRSAGQVRGASASS